MKSNKNLLSTIIAILTLILCAITIIGFTRFYPQTVIVSSVNSDDNYISCIDSTGNIWEFGPSEDYEVGDVVSIILFDNFSEPIYDDIIVKSRYSGHIDSFTDDNIEHESDINIYTISIGAVGFAGVSMAFIGVVYESKADEERRKNNSKKMEKAEFNPF